MSKQIVDSRYQVFICLVLGFTVVYWLKPVLLPFTIALFMMAVAWPMTIRLNRIFHKRISYVVSCLALAIIIGAFIAITYLAVSQFVSHLPNYESQFYDLINQLRSGVRSIGLPAPNITLDSEKMNEYFTPMIGLFYATLGHIILIIALVMLGLPELVYWDDKLDNCFGKNSNKWREAGAEAATSFQRYMSVTTAIGVLSAVLTAGFSLAIGLEFAMLWGLLAFIMNFIPVLGSFLVLIPPILVAMMQFTDPTMIWVAALGFGMIQFFMGNVIDPIFQGKFLAMSPVVILLSIAFWSLLWGPAGAFLAVPLTYVFIIICSQFQGTKPLACMMSEGKGQRIC